MQISTLIVLGPHPMRPELITRAKETAHATILCLKKFEEHMTATLEEVCEKSLEESAQTVKEIEDLSRHVPEAEVFKQMHSVVRSYHSGLTSQASDKEEELRAQISQFFEKHQARMQALIIKLNKL